MFKRLGIFKSVLISYIAITLIPISALLLITVHHVNVSYAQGILNNRYANLQRTQAMLDLRLRECKSIANQFTQNLHISRFTLGGSSSYDAYLALKELARVKETNEFLQDVGVHYFENDALYSALGMTKLSLAMTANYQLSKAEAQSLAETIGSAKKPTLVSMRNHTRVFYIIPLPLNYPSANGVALFLFDNAAMNELFSDYGKEFHDLRFCMRADGELLYASSEDTIRAAKALSGLPKTDEIVYGGASYRVISVGSADGNGLASVSLVKESALTPVFEGYATLLLSALAVTLVCLTLATQFAMRYWTPIRELNALVSAGKEKNLHWEPIQAAVRNALDKTYRLEGALDDQARVMRENFLLRLISGQGQSARDLAGEMHSLGLNAAYERASVLAVLLPGPHHADAVFGHLKSREPDACCAVEVGGANCVVVAVFVREPGEIPDTVKRFAQELLAALVKAGAAGSTIGVGRSMPLRELKWSYLQAMAVLKGGAAGEGPIAYINEIPSDTRMLPDLYEKEMILDLAIRQGNGQLACQMIDEMMRQTLDSAPSMYRYACYCLLNRVMTVYGEQPELAGTLPLNGVWHALVETIDNAMPQDFVNQLCGVVRQICDRRTDLSRLREDQYVCEVLDFVSKNCLRCDFSLDTLTEKFGSSGCYWSRFFKERLNLGFSEYVWQLRLSKAKELFERTDLPVKDVVERVGYIDTRSFIRKFKSIEGVTPGQYKSIHGTELKHEVI
ncbi:MAG TPA: helix-turn-helix domain-containing protein [Clostridia bacterium]|nr:helix-turn-helix domain-containing protein [Clostridia bacterium]